MRQDPNVLRIQGQEHPRELWYARELTRWVLQLQPNASEALRLAARSQHLERWKIPRSDFPPGRVGYLNWRKKLSQYHASRAEETLRALHYSEEIVQRVRELNLKQDIRHDLETQVLEDALCLVFLESQFAEFSEKTEEAKLVEIIQKTWKKMSSKGHANGSAIGSRRGDPEAHRTSHFQTRLRRSPVSLVVNKPKRQGPRKAAETWRS